MGFFDRGDEIDRLERDLRWLSEWGATEKDRKNYQMGVARVRREYQDQATREGRRYGDRRFRPRSYPMEPRTLWDWLTGR